MPSISKTSHTKLKKFGFTDAEINQLEGTKHISWKLPSLINLYPILTLSPFNITKDDLIRIIKREGGGITLEKLHGTYEALTNLNFTHQQILDIATKFNGAANTYDALIEHTDALSEKFNLNEIASIASNHGGGGALSFILHKYDALVNCNFTHDQIFRIARNGGSTSTITTILELFNDQNENTQTLLKKFDLEEITQIVDFDSGGKTLRAVLKHYQKLRETCEFEHFEIVQMAKRNGASKNLEALAMNSEALFRAGYTNEQLYSNFCKGGASHKVTALLNSKPQTTKTRSKRKMNNAEVEKCIDNDIREIESQTKRPALPTQTDNVTSAHLSIQSTSQQKSIYEMSSAEFQGFAQRFSNIIHPAYFDIDQLSQQQAVSSLEVPPTSVSSLYMNPIHQGSSSYEPQNISLNQAPYLPELQHMHISSFLLNSPQINTETPPHTFLQASQYQSCFESSQQADLSLAVAETLHST